MGYIDDKKRELEEYLPPLTRKPDFDSFWAQNIADSDAKPLNSKLVERENYPFDGVGVYDFQYDGCDDTVINGYYMVPRYLNKDSYPCVIILHGFGGNKGHPSSRMAWLMMGFCVVVMDIRGHSGTTADAHVYKTGMTKYICSQGATDKHDFYYKHAVMDCYRAIDFALSQPEVDKNRLIIMGGSQGGGLALTLAALSDKLFAAIADVPSNCDLVRRIVGNHGAYGALTDYIKVYPDEADQIFETMSYFDNINFADKIKCPLLASVGLKDDVCPAEFFFGAYNRVTAPKEVVLYPFSGHEGGGSLQSEYMFEWVRRILG